MANHRSDPTANAAIGSVSKEWNRMKKRAKRLVWLKEQGLLTPAQERLARREFRGIYRRLLERPWDEDEEE